MATILIVEDDNNLSRGIAYSFEKEGFAVYCADTLSEGNSLFAQHAVDIVILDLNLPDGDGVDFCKTIREKSNVPILMLTARDLETDELSGLAAGADDYITKPFSISILRARVDSLLRRISVADKSTIHSGVLDRILARDEKLRTEITTEDRISKLKHKASRIMDMYISEAAQTTEEKEIIQGFISDMAHQMKTPLAGISMYADLLIENNASPEEQQEFFYRIKSSTENLQWMMESLIKMSRLEVGAIQLSPINQPIKQTISDSITSVLAAASKKNIDISVADFEDMQLLHDKRWTQEAFVNILENAIKYSDENGKIHISVERLPMHTKIAFKDYGIGIDKNDWHKIFKRFYRGQNAKTTEGAGLGLYLVTLIMEKQCGYVMVDSVVGEYASFSLFFQN